MESMLVRLKSYDVRRGHVLRRYTYASIKFQEERGWVRVEKPVADYLRTVHQLPGNPHSPLAFDVCTDEEAKALEASQAEASKGRRSAVDNIPLAVARPYGPGTPAAVSKPTPAPDKGNEKGGPPDKQERK